MALIESGLRGFQQKTRRGGRKIRVLQLLLGRRIERDAAQRLRSRPAIGRATGIGSSNARSEGGGGIFSRNSGGATRTLRGRLDF